MPDYHELLQELDPKTRDELRVLNSLKEEIEAINWYNQRISASDNDIVKKILGHNKRDEIEHASMLLEWLRRNMDGWDEKLKTYLFTEGEISLIEKKENTSTTKQPSDLNIGKLS